MKKQYLFTIIISIVLTFIFFKPVFFNFSTHLTSRADGVFIAWTINHVTSSLIQNKDIFQAPIFYPYENTLSYSDPFISTSILNIPFYLVSKDIIVLNNIHLILGTIFIYLSIYLLARELKFNNLASQATSFIFTFSQIHIERSVHLQSYLVAGIPLTYLFLLKWRKNSKSLWLLLTAIVFIYQTLNSPMSGMFIVFSLLPLLLNKSFLIKIRKNLLLVILYSLATLSIIAMVYYPYLLTSQNFNYTRTIRDTAHFSHSVNRFIKLDLFIIYLIIITTWLTRNKTKINKYIDNNLSIKIFVLLTLIGATLMLGPVLKINNVTFKLFHLPIPLPYGVLYYIVPGFKAFRDSSRWILLFIFGLSLVTGKLINYSNIKHKYKVVFFLIFIIFQYSININSFKIYKIPKTIPDIYPIVKEQDEIILAEFPVYFWGMTPYAYLENDKLFLQNYHKKILFNGVSGFTPPDRQDEIERLWKNFPNNESLLYLNSQGVELILIHYDLYQDMNENEFVYDKYKSLNKEQLMNKVLDQKNLKLISCEKDKCLYKLL